MTNPTQIINQDSKRYFMFTKPQRVTRAMHSLEGLLKGIAMDGEITLDEVNILKNWLEENQPILQHDPFNDLKTLIDNSLADGRIDDDEKRDILWFCNKFTSEDNYFSAITSDLQRLHGILGGIISDNVIEKNELDGLKNWLNEHRELESCWPFDEISDRVSRVLEDGKIDEAEHDMLLGFFGEFFNFSGQAQCGPGANQNPGVISRICEVDPQVRFDGYSFCLTGSSARDTRDCIRAIIEDHQGIFSDRLDETVDYLVIGAGGSPCWTFACYGRKVEQAVEWKRNGSGIQIIREEDLWRALENR